MKENVFLRKKGLNHDFRIKGSDFDGTLLELLKDYKESQDKQLIIGGVSKRFSCEDMIEASRYGYNYRDTTQFPEMDFDRNCKNNTKQWLTKFL